MGGYPLKSLNTCFLGFTRVHNPNGISIGSAVFTVLATVTDRPRYSVRNNRLHLRTQYGNAAYKFSTGAMTHWSQIAIRQWSHIFICHFDFLSVSRISQKVTNEFLNEIFGR